MARYTKSGTVSRVQEINSELEKIQESQAELFSRVGNSPNQMKTSIDMNNYDIINVRTLRADNVEVADVDFATVAQTVAADAIIAQTAADRVIGLSASITTYGSLVAAISDADIQGYAVGEVIYVQGYTSAGDGGDGYWVKTASTGTVSQTPSQLADAKFTSTDGSIWDYVSGDGTLHLKAIGGKNDGVTNNDLVFVAASNSVFSHHILNAGGTWRCTTYPITSNMCLEGLAGDRATLKLIDGGHKIVLYGEDVVNVTIRNLKVDGNKINQSLGTGNNYRGIYLLGACENIHVENVNVSSCVDHGIFLSNGGVPSNNCGKDSTFYNVIVTDCGSQSHIDAGGAGGTGIVGGINSTAYTSCYAYGNYLNGFKGNGTYTSCYSYDNINGGFETGFGSPSLPQAKWVQCAAINNGGTGWRNQGEGDELTWIGCLAEGNGRSGILLLNSVNRATISGCWFKNNGQLSNNGLDVRSDTEGFDGITLTGTSSNPDNVIIDTSHFIDDQTTKTQEFGIYMRKEVPNVVISDNNIFGDAKTQPFYAELDAADSNVKVGKCFGLSTYRNDTASVVLTGTTATTALTSHTIDERAFLSTTRLRLTAAGDTAGLNADKNIVIQVGATVTTVGTVSAGNEDSYYLEVEIVRHGVKAYVSYKCFIEGTTPTEGMFTTAASFSGTLPVKTQGKLDSNDDSITQQRFTLEQV